MILLLGCVMGGGTRAWSFEDASLVSAFVENGEISVQSSEEDVTVVHWDGGGVGESAWPRVHVSDGHVVVDADGGLLGGGDLSISVPKGVDLDLVLDRGSIEVDLDAATSVSSCLGAGDTSIHLPAGRYAMDIVVAAGSIVSEELIDDPNSTFAIHACVGAGSLEIEAN